MVLTKLFTQMRNEWRANLWLALELTIVSVVLWYCIDFLSVNYAILAEPRGHDITHVYKISFGFTDEVHNYSSEQRADMMEELRQRIKRLPEVEAAAYSSMSAPYNGGMRSSQLWDTDSVNHLYSMGGIHRWVQPEFFAVYRVHGSRGESPERLMELLPAGHNVFGATENLMCDSTYTFPPMTDLIGRKFILNGYPDHTLAAVTPGFKRFDFDSQTQRSVISGVWDMMVHPALPMATELSVRVRANMDSDDFAERLMDYSESQLRVDALYIYNVQRMTDIREANQLVYTVPMRNATVGIVFLLLNIFLGLLGTFWFRTQQRTSEIALLKVCGATSATVFRRLMAEGLLLLLIITPVAVAIDFGITELQFNAYYDYAFFTLPRMALCAGLTLLLMAGMIVAGIYFPARRAMAVQPAQALHDE